jgi:predicted phosphate transport protein (TIGR00153 family)
MRWFLPRNDSFLELFDQASANIVAGIAVFRELVGELPTTTAKVEELKALEHEGDRITHQTLARLNTTFITPFDREDIHALATRLDDILDVTDAAGQRLLLYRINGVPPQVLALTDLLLSATRKVQLAVTALHDAKKHKDALAACVDINSIENEADSIHREALAELFAGSTDAIHIMKQKEIFSFLEEATDRCEDVANVIETIIIKNS